MNIKIEPLTFVCAICGKVAARVQLLPPGAPDPPIPANAKYNIFIPRSPGYAYLFVDGVVCNSQRRLDPLAFKLVKEAMDAGDVTALYKLESEYVPSYCPQCKKHYCSEHWKKTVTYDGPFYDCTNGVCPGGHERELDD